jgi:hypothetical protein
MLSMQKTPTFILPPTANLNSHNPHGIQPNPTVDHRNSTRALSLSEIPAFPDGPSMDDALSRHESISTDGTSNESPESWDGESHSDSSPSVDYEIKIHDGSYPFVDSTLAPLPSSSSSATATAIMTTGSKHFQINYVASNNMNVSMADNVNPKVEEIDGAEDLRSIKPLEAENAMVSASNHPSTTTSTAAPVNVPRKRGRPRKHPLPVPGGQIKITKGRSKTGCITCRRRKKKCDETKPS